MNRPILSLLVILSSPLLSEAGRCVSRGVVRGSTVVAVQPATTVVTATPQTVIQTQNVFSTTSQSSWGGALGQLSQQQQYEYFQQIARELGRLAERQEQLTRFAERLQGPPAINFSYTAQPRGYAPSQPPAASYGGGYAANYAAQQQRSYYNHNAERGESDRDLAAQRRQALQYDPPAAARTGGCPGDGGPARSRSGPSGSCRATQPSATRQQQLQASACEPLPPPRPPASQRATAAACVRCHGPASAEADLRLDRAAELTGPQRRRAVERMLAGEMPPDMDLTVDEIWQIASELMQTEADRQRLLEILTRP